MEPEQATTKIPENTPAEAPAFDRPRRGTRGGGGSGRGGRGGSFARPKPEFDQKIVSIRRVTRVVSGGRRMSFSVAMIIGDKKGSVGFGTGKASDTALAIAKALKHARKNMITVSMTKTGSIPYDISAKFASSRVMLMPNRGKGIVAGSTVRDIVILLGLKDVTTKIYSRSKNGLNNAQATIKALSSIAKKRRVSVVEEAQAFTQ
jgi:small subunit ribosomal protein S5